MNRTNSEFETAKQELKSMLKDGSTVYTVLRSVSRSGMSRDITPLILTPDGPRYIQGPVHVLLNLPYGLRSGFFGVKIKGCGMDMGYHLVERMSQALGLKLNHQWL